MIERDDIHRRIKEAMPDAEILIHDLTGSGDHLQVVVVSEAFVGISELKRHRMVYQTMRDILGGALHALALKTKTPAEMVDTSRATQSLSSVRT